MRVVQPFEDLRSALDPIRRRGSSIGFVPTMGFLHEGHMSLVRESVASTDYTVVSIFVNPAQFGPEMDLDRYPQDFERDLALLKEAGVDLVFTPTREMMYPEGYSTWVDVESLTDFLDGASRPGYFRGIATVVLKLFNLVTPTRTFFGQKDYQQAVVIQKLARDLNLELEVVVMPIVREADGVAMSSRNSYLDGGQRVVARTLNKSLLAASALFADGERHAAALEDSCRAVLATEARLVIDYVRVVDAETMQPIDDVDRKACLAIACDLEGTRLIDNVELNPA